MPGRRVSAASASSGSATSMSRSTGRRAITAWWCSRALPFETHRRCESFLRQDRLPPRLRRCWASAPGCTTPITLHNFYVPAGGDLPDPALNPKFAHKLAFLDEMRAASMLRPAAAERAILVGDLNVAPLEHDVWSHKQMLRVVSHTPIECEKLTAHSERPAAGSTAMRVHTPEPAKLYTWWSYRAPDWERADRAAGSTTSDLGRRLPPTSPSIKIAKAYRGAARLSDHVPVIGRRSNSDPLGCLRSVLFCLGSRALFTSASSFDQVCKRSVMLTTSPPR